MAGSGYNVKLLLACKVNKLNSVTRNTNCKVCIFFLFGMFHSIDELFCSEDIYVKVMRSLIKVSVKNSGKIIYALFFTMTKCVGADCLSVGDTVKRPFIRQLCKGKTPKAKPPQEFWELLNALYSVHKGFKKCAIYEPSALTICKEIECLILDLQEVG